MAAADDIYIFMSHFCDVKSPTFNSFGFGNGISIKCRERFSTGVEQVTTAQNDATYPRSPRLETVNNAAHSDSSCRERPSTSDKQVTTAQNGATYPRSPSWETIDAHRAPLSAIVLSSIGMYIATASEQGTIIRVHFVSDATKAVKDTATTQVVHKKTTSEN
ncbi:hypothetical protein SO802_004952 [Lithocarpus litseifolius]|uniref:Uncharacterized protein n=1 Tax=Lithocarpus litseifolius TaxID=425828 RepID=A0AAW2DI96_9ROSI